MTGLLAAAALVSVAIGERLDAAVIAAVVILNAGIGYTQERGAERAVAGLRRLLRDTAVVIRDGRSVELDVAEIVPGDLLAIRAGDQLPADVRLLSAEEIEIDESALTGESLPIAKRAEPPVPPVTPLAERSTAAFAGTLVARGVGRGIVTATGSDTEAGRIATAAALIPPSRTPLEMRLGRLATLILGVAIVICVALAAIAYLHGDDLADSALIGISLAVAAVPEGLPAVVTIVLAVGVSRMADRGAIVRRLGAVETLGSVSVICTDKTGTLTEGKMELRRLHLCDADDLDDAIAPEDTIARTLLESALIASEPDAGTDRAAGGATESAIAEAATAIGLSRTAALAGRPVVEVRPFASDRKRMSVVLEDDESGGQLAFVKGAPETLIDRLGPGADAEPISRIAARWAEEGFRVLLVARRELEAGEDPELDLEPLGLLGLGDPVRSEAAPAVAEARSAGVRTVIVTGDHRGTAVAIARAVGVPDAGQAPRVLTGPELDRLSEPELRRRAASTDVFARVEPIHKLRIVEALKRQGQIVAMTGDGVNDVPALRAAHAGVAMGRRGTDAARESGSIVLTDDNYATIVTAVRLGRTMYDNVLHFVQFLLAANAGEILVFTLAITFGLSAPLTVLQVLLVNLLTDGLPAVALGLDPPDRAVMKRPPRPSAEGLLDPLRGRLLIGGVSTGLASFAAFLAGGGAAGEGQTMAFATLILAQLVYVFAVRGDGWFFRAGSNPALLGAVAVSTAIVATVMAVPPIAERFAIVPLSALELLTAASLASIPFVAGEAYKLFRRSRLEFRRAS